MLIRFLEVDIVKYILNKDYNIKEILDELDKIDGINVTVDEIETSGLGLSEISIVVKVNAILVELERIIILLEEQDERELAIEKLNVLYDIFTKIENGLYDISV